MDYLAKIETLCRQKMNDLCEKHSDPSHDLLHVERVVATVRKIGVAEGARLDIVIPAAWLHDCVWIEKTDPRRKQASQLSAEEAKRFLAGIGSYGQENLDLIGHAIEAHSFSAGIVPRTLEAQIVQDADRLDGLGAVGIARCFSLGGWLGRPLYDSKEPFAQSRILDDQTNTLDHFYVKLFKTAETLQTKTGRDIGRRKVAAMKSYLDDLKFEISN